MTKAEALDKLIKAVEAGTSIWPGDLDGTGLEDLQVAFGNGYNGSLDAAKTLHEALLPDDYIASSDSTGYARVWRDEFEFTHSWGVLVPGKEAMARLLATLKAYRAGL